MGVLVLSTSMMEVNSRGGECKLTVFVPYVAVDHVLVHVHMAVVGTDVTITTRWLSDGNDICSFYRFVYIT